VIPAFLQLAAWCGAFWLAVWLHGRREPRRRARVRFVLALGLGAVLARIGHSLLFGGADRILHAGASFSILFLPLGVLALAPSSAAFASLPLALAVARLGCLPAGCCRGAGGEPLPLVEASALAVLHSILARGAPDAVAERFAFAFGGFRLLESPWRGPVPAGAAATPEVVALCWIGIGALLLAARRSRTLVTERRRSTHASASLAGPHSTHPVT
jgi:hypothetical protein